MSLLLPILQIGKEALIVIPKSKVIIYGSCLHYFKVVAGMQVVKVIIALDTSVEDGLVIVVMVV